MYIFVPLNNKSWGQQHNYRTKKMKTTITITEVAAAKRQDIANLEVNRYFAGNAATDQRIDYILSLSDEAYMNICNEAARKEAVKAAVAKEKKAALSAERKATGMSKKAYRAEYERLMAEYKAGNKAAKEEAKKIQKFAF
jgi:hypothetical protein